jgi:hypothetical protein
MAAIKGKTSSGFEYELDENVLDNWDLMDAIQRYNSGETIVGTLMLRTLLGPEQTKRLREFAMTENGTPSASKMFAVFGEIVKMIPELKKS